MIPSAILTRLVASIVYELSFCCIAEDLSLVSLEEVVCVCVCQWEGWVEWGRCVSLDRK